MSSVLAVIQLNYFSHLFSLDLETCLLYFTFNSINKLFIVHLLHFDVGEKIVKE